jgi:hypothetical protein
MPGLRDNFKGNMMISTLLIFQYDNDFDEQKIAAIAEQARSKFEGFPELRSKAFTVSTEIRQAINFYVWEFADAARQFFNPDNIKMISGLYGTTPDISFLDVKVLVDNHRQ